MNNVIELEPILAKVNQKLPRKHHINNEDPIIGLIFLNQELLNAQMASAIKKNEELLSAYNAAALQHIETCKNLSETMLNNVGDMIADKVKAACKEQLNDVRNDKDRSITECILASKIGSYAFMTAGCAAAGAAIWNFVLTLGLFGIHR
jgi:hypothetical protein